MASRVTVFVSGAFDVLHAGHVQFFKDARALGDHLTVCIPTDAVVAAYKQRPPYLSAAHKEVLFMALECVDAVVFGGDHPPELNFVSAMRDVAPLILAVTADDQFQELKEEACKLADIKYVQLPKTPVIDGTCASEIRDRMVAPARVPARVDFAGGWFDVPALAHSDAKIVNCTITPMMSILQPFYEPGGGIGGSAAWALLHGKDPVKADLEQGAGWQDPAIIQETGLCVWQSGCVPRLLLKRSPNMLMGRMALKWTGKPHSTPEILANERNYELIKAAGNRAAMAVLANDYESLCTAVAASYTVQLEEGMDRIYDGLGCRVAKYCGSGWGGYILKMFERLGDRTAAIQSDPGLIPIEPYIREWA